MPDDGGSDLTGVSWRSGFDSTSYLKPLFFRPKLEDFHLRDKKFFVRQGRPSEKVVMTEFLRTVMATKDVATEYWGSEGRQGCGDIF